MKILLINQAWWCDELRAFGHEVVTYGPGDHLEINPPNSYPHIDLVLQSLPSGFTPDVLIWLDNSSPFLLQGLENCPIPLVFYSVDTQHHYGLHSHLADIADHILLAQKDYAPHFTCSSTPVTWLPAWASRYMDASDDKHYGATFVGTLNPSLNPRRVEFFEKLATLTPITFQSGDFTKIFPYAEIVVNQTVKQDLNFRVFEAMMSGALLLTERTGNGLFDLFTEEEHLVSYTPHDAQEAADKIEWLLAHPEKMRQIARAGREEILRKHLPIHRAQQVHDIITHLSKIPPRPARHYAAMINHATVSSLMFLKTGHYPAQPLIAAMQAAMQALDQGLCPDDLQAANVVRVATHFDQSTKSRAGAQLIKMFAERFNDQALLRFAEIRQMLNQGDIAAARTNAQALSSIPPEETFQNAEVIIRAILEERLDTPTAS